MGHTSRAHWSEVDRTCSAHLASGEWSLEWVGHAAIWDTPTGGEIVCYRVTQVTKSPDTKGVTVPTPTPTRGIGFVYECYLHTHTG